MREQAYTGNLLSSGPIGTGHRRTHRTRWQDLTVTRFSTQGVAPPPPLLLCIAVPPRMCASYRQTARQTERQGRVGGAGGREAGQGKGRKEKREGGGGENGDQRWAVLLIGSDRQNRREGGGRVMQKQHQTPDDPSFSHLLCQRQGVCTNSNGRRAATL